MSILLKNATLASGKKADILTEGSAIAKIAPSIAARAEEKLDATGKIALPGFINTHTHAAMSLFRGIGEGARFHEWLSAVRKAEAKATAKQISAGVRLACAEMLRSGTTCFSDMYFYMDEAAKAVKESGMRACLGYSTVDMGRSGFDEKKRKSELSTCEKFIKEWRGKAEGRITASVPPHSIYLCSQELLEESKALSEKYGVPLHIHLSETRKEVFDCLQAHKMRPAFYLDSLGALTQRTIAAHCVYLTKEEIRLLSSRGVSASLCPASNLKLAEGGIAPYPEMRALGMNVSLGTDGAASSGSLSMLHSMRLLSLIVKNSRWDASAAPAEQMLYAATAGGARALGMNAGALEEGRLADIILLDARAANIAPTQSIASSIVYAAHAGNVTDSIIGGRLVMRAGKLLTLDEEKIVEEAEKEAQRLVA